MKVLVAGATGAIGRPLVKELVARGHEVAGLARSPENEALLARLGATPKQADLFDAASLARAAKGAEVVVRAATHIPTTSRPRASEWATNDRIRIEGTRALLEAARRVGARRYVQESIVWVAQPEDGSPFDEKSPPNPHPITASALEAELLAAGAAQAGGLEAATLRLGFLYGSGTAHTQAFVAALRKRALPVIGSGEAPLAFLHIEDAAGAFAAAIELRGSGPWHVVDDRPTPVAEFLDGLARATGAPRPLRVPAWLGRLGAGAYAARLLTTPMRTTSARFQAETGWRPRYASVAEGLDEVARGLGARPADRRND